MYVYETEDSVVLLPLYVDDLLIGYCDDHHMECTRGTLQLHFKMVDAGPASWVLGICITNNFLAGCITLNQTQYVHKVLERFGMADCKPVATPPSQKNRSAQGDRPRGSGGPLLPLPTSDWVRDVCDVGD